MKVQQAENDKAFIYELGPEGTNRWFLKIYATGHEAASPEELEWIASKIVQALDGQNFDSWGCYCDLESMPEGFVPDGCVIDEDRRCDCIYASGRARVERKEDCEYWRRV